MTGVEAAEIGQDFILWTWDPVEAATGYEAAPALVGTPPDERIIEYVEETSLRAGGFEPGSEVMIHVRAVTETAGGRAAGPWSNRVDAETWGEPRACGDEREQALSFGAEGYSWGPPILIEEWAGRPFPLYFTPGYTEEDRKTAEKSLSILEDFSARLEAQIGYPIFRVVGMRQENVEWSLEAGDCSWREPRLIMGVMAGESERAAYAVPSCALYVEESEALTRGFGSVHELFHLFGFAHSAQSHKAQNPRVRGIYMSLELTDDLFATFGDVDALRCIFPEGG